MAIVMLVRAGEGGDERITARWNASIEYVQRIRGSHALRHIGAQLTRIEGAVDSDYAGPSFVVIDVISSEAEQLNHTKSGHYLIVGLAPSEVPRAE